MTLPLPNPPEDVPPKEAPRPPWSSTSTLAAASGGRRGKADRIGGGEAIDDWVVFSQPFRTSTSSDYSCARAEQRDLPREKGKGELGGGKKGEMIGKRDRVWKKPKVENEGGKARGEWGEKERKGRGRPKIPWTLPRGFFPGSETQVGGKHL